MTATAARLTTFAELEQLPDPPGGRYELHHGELVTVPPPKARHYFIQLRIQALLQEVAEGRGVAGPEMGFRALPEHEFRVADVGFLSLERRQASLDGYIIGSPEIVVEVLSPSNTASELYEKEKICIQNGCLEFWVVDPKTREVRVTTSTGTVHYYTPADQIPLYFGASIPVASIFE